jgi:hypothetical protein
MKGIKSVCLILMIGLLLACSSRQQFDVIIIENNLDIDRSNEVVELSKEILKVTVLDKTVGIKDRKSGELLLTQLVDANADGIFDLVLVQPHVPANAKIELEVVVVSLEEQPTAADLCYSRFVPERTDDYTWENDKVAFRVYGPTAQMLQESGKPGGTLSSGVDAWLKKVSYPIIDKWYKETMIDKTGSYHEDTGEGLDNFHVGVSRGVGGLAVKKNDEFYYSKNYNIWKTLTTGPLRTSFYLEYESWDAAGLKITENKVISLDLGSNLSKFETKISGTEAVYAGLTLHEKDGVTIQNTNWICYWQPHADSEIGTAIVADNKTFLSSETYDVETKDLSNAYAELKVSENKVVYYAGFAWKESNQYPTKESWISYLNTFSKQINNPLRVFSEKSY